MTTTVVHFNNPDGWDVYIGRRMPGRAAGSKWQNHFRIGDRDPIHGVLRRGDCVKLHAAEFETRNDLHECLDEIRGLRLACWCARLTQELTATSPTPYVCHGQTLACWADFGCAPNTSEETQTSLW